MTAVLVLGVGPLPIDDSDRLYAPGLRTWQFAEVLARSGHRIALGLADFGGDAENRRVPAQKLSADIDIIRLRSVAIDTVRELGALHLDRGFGCIVATTDVMNHLAASIPAAIPLWLDFNGDPFAEKQLMGARFANDATLSDQWRMMLSALLAGDRFSACSEAQRCAMIGQLAFAGRLSQDTSAEELVHCITPISRAMKSMADRLPVQSDETKPRDDTFTVLWTGGYNTWTDPETLAKGLEIAMRRDARIRFLSTGGEIAGHDEASFAAFCRLIDSSEFRDRMQFAGWVPTEQVPAFYRRADLALNLDMWSYEAELGARNRIADWIQFEVPVLTTAIAEFPRALADCAFVRTFPPGNPEKLAAAIVEAATESLESRKERSRKAREFFDREYSEEKIFAPLVEWVAKPTFAGDRQPRTSGGENRVAGWLAEAHRRLLEEAYAPAFQPPPPSSARPRSLFRKIARRIGF